MDAQPQSWTPSRAWQSLWLVTFIAALLATATAGTFVGVALQARMWDLLGFAAPAFILLSGGLFWLITRVRRVMVGPTSVTLEAAAFEREIAFADIERLVLLPRARGWMLAILYKQGGGYRLRTRTRAWPELLAQRASVSLEELDERRPVARS